MLLKLQILRSVFVSWDTFDLKLAKQNKKYHSAHAIFKEISKMWKKNHLRKLIRQRNRFLALLATNKNMHFLRLLVSSNNYDDGFEGEKNPIILELTRPVSLTVRACGHEGYDRETPAVRGAGAMTGLLVRKPFVRNSKTRTRRALE